MANHVIIQVRDAVITKLQSGVNAVSNRVYRKDEEPTDSGSCPFLMVELGSDVDERIGINGGTTAPANLEQIALTIIVHCVVKQDGDAEAAAYNLRRDVETSLLGTIAALTLDGKIQMTTRLAGDPAQDSVGDQEAYKVALQFQMLIYHLESSPDSFTY